MEVSEFDAGVDTVGRSEDVVSQDVVDEVREPRQRHKPIFRKEDLYYDMKGDKFLIILNHYTYKRTKYYKNKAPPPRKGTNEDVTALKYAFGNMGFKILVYTDFDHDQIIGHISRISKQDHSTTSCLAIAILTHGDRGGALYAADRAYNLKDLTIQLEHGHPTLVNKPKLFFIQACRGDLADAGNTVEFDGPEDDNSITIPSHSDFLFMYSTVEDYLSWRDMGGSWMIQELCTVLKDNYEDYDLLQLITIATKNVAYRRASNTPHNKSTHGKKQTPETRFTLTKFVKF